MGVTDEELAAKREQVEGLRKEIDDRVQAREDKAREAENEIAYAQLVAEGDRLQAEIDAMDQDERLVTEGVKAPEVAEGEGDQPPATPPTPASLPNPPVAPTAQGGTPTPTPAPADGDKPKEK